jgi:hypothetical protein
MGGAPYPDFEGFMEEWRSRANATHIDPHHPSSNGPVKLYIPILGGAGALGLIAIFAGIWHNLRRAKKDVQPT